MSDQGVEIITDSVKRIQLVMESDSLSLEQLQALEKIFASALRSTRKTVERAEESLTNGT